MKKLLLLSILFIAAIVSGSAQEADPCKKSTEGTDFWFGFMESRNYSNKHYLEITVTTRENTTFNIYIGKEETPFNGPYTINSNNSVGIKIPWNLVETTGSEEIQNKGIHLVSEKPVNVYALNFDQNSADVAVIYPVGSLGDEYFAMCYEPHIHERNNGDYGNGRNSQFLVVATEDSTQVMIIPSKVTDKLVHAGDTININLNKGETYQVQSMNRDNLSGQGDLTGSYIKSNKPLAFYSGSLATTIPAESGTSAWDHLYEQVPPVPSWGREYFAVPLKSREQDRYRIMAAQNNTNVYITGQAPFILNRGEFKEIVLYYNEASRIFADKPIMVAQFSQSQSVDDSYTGGNGDPFMIILSSVTQAKNDVTFVAYDSEKIKKYFVNIVALTGEVPNILFDGSSIQNEFSPFPDSKYSYAQKSITPGTHRIQNLNEDRGFLAYVYGYGGVESYGYGVGFNLDLVLDLGESINFNGDTISLCGGEEITLDAGPYFDTYLWNTDSTTQKLDVTQGGKYKVQTTTVDGCFLEDSIYVYLSEPKVELDTHHEEGCSPYSIELKAEDGFEKYLWQNQDDDSLSTNQIITADSTGEYRLTVLNKYNCPARDTMSLVVFPVPKITLEGDTLVCGVKTASLSATISDAPESVWKIDGNYKWSSNKPVQLFISDTDHTNADLEAQEWGDYEIYYDLQTADGCMVYDTFQVRFHPTPTTDFIFEDDTKCEGYSKTLIYTGSATDSAKFYWDLGGCQFVDTLDSKTYSVSVGAFLSEPPHIQLYINDNGCPSDTTIKPLGAKPNFTMDADHTRGCDSLTVNFSSELLTDDKVDFVWTFDDGKVVENQNATKHYATKGFYGVQLTITNPVTQCQNGFTLDSMIKVFPTPSAHITADPDYCYPDSAQLVYTNNIDSSICNWTFNGAHQSGTGNDSIVMWLDEPFARAFLTVDEYGCMSDTAQITLKRKPHFDLDTERTEGCQPYLVNVNAIPLDDRLAYYWITDSLPYPEGDSYNFLLSDTGRTDISVIATSQETGCYDTLLKPDWIWVHPKPLADFAVDYPVALLEHAEITYTNTSDLAEKYSWDFGDGEISNEENTKHTFTELGDYNSVLIAESEYACLDTASLEIKILPFSVFTSNAFRPDSDIPENRTFMPVGTGADLSRFNLKIYNRWGEVVFNTNSPDHPWDGSTRKGHPAPGGNYIWIANYYDIQGFEHNQKGQVVLIR